MAIDPIPIPTIPVSGTPVLAAPIRQVFVDLASRENAIIDGVNLHTIQIQFLESIVEILDPVDGNLVKMNIAGYLQDSGINSSEVTTAGNTFNGNDQLVQLNGTGQLPVLNGSNLTSLNASSLASGTVSSARLPQGTSSAIGANKLYTSLGTNIDGGVDQNTLNTQVSTLNGSIATKMNLVSSPTNGNLVSMNASGNSLNSGVLVTSITTQGNSFNGNSQLVQNTAGGLLPVLNGSNLTSLNASNLSTGTVASARLPQATSANLGAVNLYTTINGTSTTGGVDQNTLNSLLGTIGYETRFSKTGMSWALANGSTTNLVNGLGTSQGGTLATTNYINPSTSTAICTLLSGGSPTGITTFPFSGYLHYAISLRIVGNISGSLAGNPVVTLQLQRTSDNTIITSKSIAVSATGSFTISETIDSLTNTSSDPFITGGFYIGIINNAGSAYTISSLFIGVRGGL